MTSTEKKDFLANASLEIQLIELVKNLVLENKKPTLAKQSLKRKSENIHELVEPLPKKMKYK